MLIIDIGHEHRLFATVAETGPGPVGQITAVIGIRQTVQKQVIGQFVRALVAVGIVVRQAIVQQQLSAVAHRLGIRQPAAQIVSARIVGDILVELGRRVGIEIARQRIAIVVLIVFRQTALKRGNQHTAGPTAETVHPDQTARQVVAGRPIAGKAFQKVQDRPFDTGPPRQCRRRIAARHVVGLETKRRTEHQRIVRVDFVLDARVEPMIEVTGTRSSYIVILLLDEIVPVRQRLGSYCPRQS